MKVYTLQLLAGLHILSAAVFVGSNSLLEALLRRLALIPPRDAATLSDRLGVDLAVVNFTALGLLGATGVARLFVSEIAGQALKLSFWTSGYGLALAPMVGIWVTLIASALTLMWLRGRAVPKLPFDATREDVGQRAEDAMRAAALMRKLGVYNLIAGAAVILVGGFLRYGGFR